MRAHRTAGTVLAALSAALVLASGAPPAAAQPGQIQVAPPKPDASTSTALTGRITGIAVDPSAPKPDATIRVKVDGFGNCKVWFGLELVEAASPSPYPSSSGWNPLGGLYGALRGPDATLKLPGELPSLHLAAGKWKVGVDAHEGFSGNCKGRAELTFVVGASKTLTVGGAQGPAVGGVAPAPQTGNNTKAPGPQGQAGAGAAAQGNAATTSSLASRITALSIQPAAPKPEETIRVKLDGIGTCKVWFSMAQLEGNPYPVPSGWSPAGVISELTRPPDATLKLPGELTPLRLGAGRWKIAASAHEGISGSNCKGNVVLEFLVADQAPLAVQMKGGPPPPAAGNAAAGGNASQGPGGAAQSNAGGTGPASSASTLAQRITSVRISPATPKPDEPIRILVDGVGTCKVWLFMAQLAGPKSPLPPSWNPMGLVGELTRPPDATLKLPGELAPVRLGPGTWKVRVDSHEGFKGGNCKGYPEVEFVVADRGLARPAR